MKFEVDEFVSIELERFEGDDFSIVLSDPENSTCFGLDEAKTLRNALDLMIGEIEKSERLETEQQERKVLKLTAECWNEFIKLKPTHPSDIGDFADGIHALQKILALRMCRRDRPDIFPIKE